VQVTATKARPTIPGVWPVVVDLLCVLALALGGKNSHDEAGSFWLVLVIAWPFALAAVLAHLWLTLRGRQAARIWPEGAIVLAVTYVLGMVLRAVSGRGLDPAFLVVAGLFLALTMLGWRGGSQLVRRRVARNR
jgi:peptidoglycan/LPS O-acetylase OafA/YrhL